MGMLDRFEKYAQRRSQRLMRKVRTYEDKVVAQFVRLGGLEEKWAKHFPFSSFDDYLLGRDSTIAFLTTITLSPMQTNATSKEGNRPRSIREIQKGVSNGSVSAKDADSLRKKLSPLLIKYCEAVFREGDLDKVYVKYSICPPGNIDEQLSGTIDDFEFTSEGRLIGSRPKRLGNSLLRQSLPWNRLRAGPPLRKPRGKEKQISYRPDMESLEDKRGQSGAAGSESDDGD